MKKILIAIFCLTSYYGFAQFINPSNTWVNYTGNVGIGNSNPQARLDVNGTFKLINTTAVDSIQNSTLTNSQNNIPTSYSVFTALSLKANKADSSLWKLNGVDGYNKNSGNIGIGYTSPQDKLCIDGNIVLGISGYNEPTYHGIFFAGNQSSWSVGVTGATDTLNGKDLLIYAGDSYKGYDKNGGNASLSSGYSTGTGSSDISFLTASAGVSGNSINYPTNKMIIKGSGNIGIGYTNPSAKLTVNGNVGIGTTTAVDRLSIVNDIVNYDSSLFVTKAGALAIGTSSPTGKFHIQNSVTGNDSDFCVRKSGRVGIATTSPSTSLHIWSSNGQQARIRVGQSQNAMVNVSDTMSGVELQSTSVSINQFYPAIKWQTNDADHTTKNPIVGALITAVATESINSDTKTGTALIFSTTANTAGASTVPSEAMRIDQSGNVGIGITNPAYKLSVKGYATADSLRINTTKIKAPVAGAMYFHGDTLYIYNGAAWKQKKMD